MTESETLYIPVHRIRFCAWHHQRVVDLGHRGNWERILKTGEMCAVEGCKWLVSFIERPFTYSGEPEEL